MARGGGDRRGPGPGHRACQVRRRTSWLAWSGDGRQRGRRGRPCDVVERTGRRPRGGALRTPITASVPGPSLPAAPPSSAPPPTAPPSSTSPPTASPLPRSGGAPGARGCGVRGRRRSTLGRGSTGCGGGTRREQPDGQGRGAESGQYGRGGDTGCQAGSAQHDDRCRCRRRRLGSAAETGASSFGGAAHAACQCAQRGAADGAGSAGGGVCHADDRLRGLVEDIHHCYLPIRAKCVAGCPGPQCRATAAARARNRQVRMPFAETRSRISGRHGRCSPGDLVTQTIRRPPPRCHTPTIGVPRDVGEVRPRPELSPVPARPTDLGPAG